jgi:mono/diheme cytochrome c family protein
MGTRLRGGQVVAAMAAVAVLLLIGVAAGQPPPEPAQDALAGSRVFGAKGCVRCHAVGGAGGRTGPDLSRGPRARTFFDLAAALWNHAPAMGDRMRALGIARPLLDAREAGDLVAFLYTREYFETPGRPEVGRLLFRDKHCIVCHQVGGAGGVVGPGLDDLKRQGTPIYVAAAMWNHGPRMTEAMKARNLVRPRFRDDELRDLLAFIASASPVLPDGPLHVLPGRADSGRRLFVAKRCAECHRIGGTGAAGAPDLTQSAGSRSVIQLAQVMWNKAPAMAEAMRGRAIAMPSLTPDEMADIVAYLYSVRYFAHAGDPGKGAAVATAKGCLGCHGQRGGAGDFGAPTPVDSPAGVVAALWNHAFLGEPPPRREGRRWATMTADDMTHLMAFLQARPRRP